MKEKIILYNHFHYGDIFYSRTIVNVLMEYFDIIYYHNLNLHLFEDLPNVTEITGIPAHYDIHGTNLENKIVNTWIGQKQMHYVTHQPIPGCSFVNHFKLVIDICNFYKIPLDKEISNYLPSVNYENLKNYKKIKDKMDILNDKYPLIVLVCDGNVNSGQSINFDFTPIVTLLSNQNQNLLFLTTSNHYPENDNVININSEITNKLPDLLEISLISNYCNIIIGRASGPFCFTHTNFNFSNKDKTNISFTFNETEGIFYYDGNNKNLWSNNFDYHNMVNVIQNEINLKIQKL